MKEIEISIKVNNGELDPEGVKNEIVKFIRDKYSECETIKTWILKPNFKVEYSIDSVVEMEKN